jgi:RHS repeat-associated protein
MEYGDDLGSIVYYRYDDTGKVSTMLDGDWTPIRYFYYEDGQLIYLENGYGSGNGISRQEFTYDGLGRLSGVVYKNEAGAVQEQYTITYNEAGKITREDISTNYNALPMSTVKEYAYDALGRLIQEKIDGVITAYTYDAVGNRLSESSGGNTKTYAYDAYDCLTSISTNGTIAASYSYDVSGNQVSRTQGTVTTDYAYDAANHLTQVREGGSVVASYEYDAAGQRTKKSVDGETVNYYYDGIDLLYTEDGSGQTIDVNILEEDGSLIATMQGSDMWWYRQDIRGSITNVVDSEGNLGKSYIYSAYGSTQSEGTFTGSFAYTGALLDEETGLCYMNARYYDSETGRFISEDTHRGDGEEYWHLYAYCEGDPVNYTDKSGHRRTYSNWWRGTTLFYTNKGLWSTGGLLLSGGIKIGIFAVGNGVIKAIKWTLRGFSAYRALAWKTTYYVTNTLYRNTYESGYYLYTTVAQTTRVYRYGYYSGYMYQTFRSWNTRNP